MMWRLDMLTAVKGYYDGSKIVIDDDIPMKIGQEVIVTLVSESRQEHGNIDLKSYMNRGPKMFHDDAQKYVSGLRDNDRI